MLWVGESGASAEEDKEREETTSVMWCGVKLARIIGRRTIFCGPGVRGTR
jgi:hypothetical protein